MENHGAGYAGGWAEGRVAVCCWGKNAPDDWESRSGGQDTVTKTGQPLSGYCSVKTRVRDSLHHDDVGMPLVDIPTPSPRSLSRINTPVSPPLRQAVWGLRIFKRNAPPDRLRVAQAREGREVDDSLKDGVGGLETDRTEPVSPLSLDCRALFACLGGRNHPASYKCMIIRDRGVRANDKHALTNIPCPRQLEDRSQGRRLPPRGLSGRERERERSMKGCEFL